MTVTLRPDQFELKRGVYNSWQRGNRNVLAMLATGGGKSVVMSDIANDHINVEQAIIAHRRELVGQMSIHIGRRGIKHKIIAPSNVVREITAQHREEFNGYSYINPTASCAVAGIDTIISKSRESDMRKWAERVQLWQMDEGHHTLVDNKWGRGLAYFVNARGILWTASPGRPDGKGLGRHADGLADDLVRGLDMRALIDMRALCDYEIVCPTSDLHVEGDIPPSGDYSKQQLSAAGENSKRIVGDVVMSYFKYAFGKRGITFATDVKTAQKIADQFNAMGIKAAAVSAESDDSYRVEMLKRFRRGELMQLVNVDLFGEGFDVPGVEVVSMARPTASLVVYLQQFGRVLRTAPGKLYGLLIDHVSNVKLHGLPDKPRHWSLDRRDKRASSPPDPNDVPITVCKACSKPYERVYHVCPYCGAVPLPAPQARAIEVVDGDLTRLDIAALAELRKAMELPSPATMAERAGFAGGAAAAAGMFARMKERHAAQHELNEVIALWAAHQRAAGKPDSESYMRFYHAIGMDVYSALAQDRQAMEKITGDVRQWLTR